MPTISFPMHPTQTCSSLSSPSSRITWLLHQLLDSSLPTSSFITSSGLEASLHLLPSIPISQHLVASLQSYARTTLPLLSHTLTLPLSLTVFEEWDDVVDACTANAVTRAANKKLGQGLLMVYVKCFMEEGAKVVEEIIRKMREGIREGAFHGHYVVIWGLICRALGIPSREVASTYMFLQARSLVSTAIRLGVMGPFQGQRELLTLEEHVDEWIDQWYHPNWDKLAASTAPALDLCQGMHGRLYTRLFHS